jgi:hypothetical protein
VVVDVTVMLVPRVWIDVMPQRSSSTGPVFVAPAAVLDGSLGVHLQDDQNIRRKTDEVVGS